MSEPLAWLLVFLAAVAGYAFRAPEVRDAQDTAAEAQEVAREFADAAEGCLASVDRYLAPIPHDGPACRPLLITRDNP